MFVAVSCDLSSDDRRKAVYALLEQYGLRKVHEALYESAELRESVLGRLKLDIDRVTDSYDSLRLYQYPMAGTMVITSLKEKKWRRYTLKISS